MASPREIDVNPNTAPNAPFFARKVNSGSASLDKFAGVEAMFDDITRQPSRAAGAGITLVADVPVTVRRASFKVENAAISVPNANEYGSVKLCDLPDRNILVLNAEFVGTLLFGGDFATNDDGDFGIGTAAASATPLATTMINLGSGAVDNLTAGAATAVTFTKAGASAADQANVLVPDGAANALYLNYSADTGQLAAEGTIAVNGTVDIWYIDLGNVGS